MSLDLVNDRRPKLPDGRVPSPSFLIRVLGFKYICFMFEENSTFVSLHDGSEISFLQEKIPMIGCSYWGFVTTRTVYDLSGL